MSLIGNPLVSTNYQTDTFSGDNSTVAYTLSVAPASAASIAVYISGLYQTPVSAYIVSGTTLTFTGAPPTGTGNILVLHLGIQSSTLVPVNGSVTPAMLHNANAIFWSASNNNIGIGNTSPTHLLSIGGDVSVSGVATLATTIHNGAATFANVVTVASSGVTFADTTQFNTAASFGMRNRIINGGFDFWQRRTSGNVTGSGYPAPDRWQWIFDGTPSSTGTVSRQSFAPGQTDVPGSPRYYLQYAYTAVNTPNHYIRQPIESVYTLAGLVCTFSFWARCTSGTIACQFQNQQEFGQGGSPSAGVYGIGTTNFTLTTTWQRFTFTHTMPSIAGKTVGTTYDGSINPSIYFPTNSSGTIQLANIQLEEGSVATPFERRYLGTELALCQRYYETGTCFGMYKGSDDTFGWTQYKVTKRVNPALSISPPYDASLTNYVYYYSTDVNDRGSRNVNEINNSTWTQTTDFRSGFIAIIGGFTPVSINDAMWTGIYYANAEL